MADPMVERIQRNPKYLELRAKRNKLGWTLAILMWVVYYGYIALIAFDKEFLARPLGTGVTTIGIPIGFGVIICAVAMIAYYVRRANSEFDSITRAILEDAASEAPASNESTI